MIAQSTLTETFMILEGFEKALNIAGYFPVIGSFSGWIRGNYAKLEAIAGIAFSILSLRNHLKGNAELARRSLMAGVTLINHAILNILRSYIEEVPTLPLVTTLPYDLCATYVLGRRFFPYI